MSMAIMVDVWKKMVSELEEYNKKKKDREEIKGFSCRIDT